MRPRSSSLSLSGATRVGAAPRRASPSRRYLQIELDKPEHADYCASAADGLSFVKANLVLNQTARVQTNTMACTWTMSTLEGEARTAYNKVCAASATPLPR